VKALRLVGRQAALVARHRRCAHGTGEGGRRELGKATTRQFHPRFRPLPARSATPPLTRVNGGILLANLHNEDARGMVRLADARLTATGMSCSTPPMT